MQNSIERLHPDWQVIVEKALAAMDKNYLADLWAKNDWLPGQENAFAAFSQPLEKMRYILLGESPYPRAISANGYAFWDDSVENLWSATGLSKQVNRATSLRNFIKMLLVTEGDLQEDLSQEAIQQIDKAKYVQNASDFFTGMLERGFLLLNACLVYRADEVKYHAKQWRLFMKDLFQQLARIKPDIEFILFGAIAQQIPETQLFSCVIAEHPYNISFITNKDVQNFFQPLHLLRPYDQFDNKY